MSPQTARLRLLPAEPALAGRLAAFYARNAAHLAPWEPRRAQLADAVTQQLWLAQQAQAAAEGTAWRWLLEEGDQLIGTVALSGVQRGFHHSAQLGYALDARAQGRGLMQEALEAVIAQAFGPLNLHRIQAACLPANTRSLGLLRRLGFREIGLAQAYLCIDGRWQDHLLLERLNPGFQPPADWL